MKERPILFSAPMVRAILDGSKTQTRHAVKMRGVGFIGGTGQRDDPAAWGYFFDGPDHHGYMVLARGLDERFDNGSISIPCPYGDRGDRLWVRETFQRSPDGMIYRATASEHGMVDFGGEGPWKPSIFMRRAESRINLAVESVTVERLQAITEEDARAEGVSPMFKVSFDGKPIEFREILPGSLADHGGGYRNGFEYLWREINSAASWDENPWVWRIGFRRIEAGK